MASVFSRIVHGELPCYRVHENEEFLAFLDISPLSKGHTLVIPKLEVDYYFDLPLETRLRMESFIDVVSNAIKAFTNCKRVGVAIIGFEVPHAHVHLIPMNHTSDLNFSNEKIKLTDTEFSHIASQISNIINQ